MRRALPGFDPATTPSVGMGAVAEMVRVWPGARRSTHPARSWSAVGSRAGDLVAEHDLNDVHGEASPLGAAWKADARMLLAGVGHDKCTALHLAETRAQHKLKRYAEDRSWLRESDGRRKCATGHWPSMTATSRASAPPSNPPLMCRSRSSETVSYMRSVCAIS